LNYYFCAQGQRIHQQSDTHHQHHIGHHLCQPSRPKLDPQHHQSGVESSPPIIAHHSYLNIMTRVITLLVTTSMAVSAAALSGETAGNTLSRRQALASATGGGAIGLAAAALVSQARPVRAAATTATSPPTAEELNRIRVGYQQIEDLLNNFEEATTVCRENGGECKRDAEPIRELMKCLTVLL
jgi:hypothetical protein